MKKKEREIEKKTTYNNLTLSPTSFWYYGPQLKWQRHKSGQLSSNYLFTLFHSNMCFQQSTLNQNIWYALIFSPVKNNESSFLKVKAITGSEKKLAISLSICTYNFTQHKPLTKSRPEVCVFTDLWFRILKWNRKHPSILDVCICISKLACRWLRAQLLKFPLTIDFWDTKNFFTGKRTAASQGVTFKLQYKLTALLPLPLEIIKSNQNLTYMQSKELIEKYYI